MKIRNLIQPKKLKTLRSMLGRLFAVVSVTSIIAACTTVNETSHADSYQKGCMAERADIVDAANWDNVQSNRVTIINGEIRPMVSHYEENRPYIIQVRNADRVNHDLWSPEFFKQAVAVDSVQFGDKAATKGCVNGIRVKARSIVTIRLVPVWEGRYEIFNSSSFLHTPTGPDAVIYIVPPRIGTASK